MAHRPRIVIYTRAQCGLCRRAEEVVAREAGRARVEHVDVDTDEALLRAYGVRVPVVVIDGVEVAEVEVTRGEIRRALRTVRSRSARVRWPFRRSQPPT